MLRHPLKRAISVRISHDEIRDIALISEALRFIDDHAGSDTSWIRTRRLLGDAAADPSLRRVRAATRAFDETVRKLGFSA